MPGWSDCHFQIWEKLHWGMSTTVKQWRLSSSFCACPSWLFGGGSAWDDIGASESEVSPCTDSYFSVGCWNAASKVDDDLSILVFLFTGTSSLGLDFLLMPFGLLGGDSIPLMRSFEGGETSDVVSEISEMWDGDRFC